MAKTVYRHKMSAELTEKIQEFATVHRFSPYKDIKDAWTAFAKNENVENLITEDRERLEEEGYVGDHNRKLFVSMRYYHMRVKPENKERKKYQKSESPATNADIERIREYMSDICVAAKPAVLWADFTMKWPEYQGSKFVHKAFVNKLQYMKKQKKSNPVVV